MKGGLSNQIDKNKVRKKIEKFLIIGFVFGGIITGLIISLVALEVYSQEKHNIYPVLVLLLIGLFSLIFVIRKKILKWRDKIKE
jgi:hypothetical protein